jgi:hypothetical protein
MSRFVPEFIGIEVLVDDDHDVGQAGAEVVFPARGVSAASPETDECPADWIGP